MLDIKDRIDVIVGIPTLNEEETIGNVVKKVDLGLCKYFPDYRALIVNVDSDSVDRTRFVFNRTITKTPKLFLKGKSPTRGKGTNLFNLIKIALKRKAKYICTVDGDLYSIEPQWIKKLLIPLVNNEAEYVTPLYTRNRYEGNTTNHFCVPFLEYAFGKNVRQPIGGEYALNSKFAKYIWREHKPAYSYKYGIDMFLTGHAVGGGFNISEVWLGRKIHKPSFGKMPSIFEHEAGVAYYVINRYRHIRNSKSIIKSAKKRWAIDSSFKKPDEESIRERKKLAIKLFREVVNKSYRGLSRNIILEIKDNNYQVSRSLWTKILTNLFEYARSRNELAEKDINNMAKLTLPLYLFRVLTYFQEIEGRPVEYIEKLLDYTF